MVLMTSLKNGSGEFTKNSLHVEKIVFKLDLGSQKWPKTGLLREIGKLLLRPTKELIFLLTKLFFIHDNKNEPTHSGKNLYVGKNVLKLTTIKIFENGNLTTCRKSNFSTMKLVIKYTEVNLPRT